ncbi:crystallin J1C [Biomphalaria pfeifferi]|uniref:Crystallin J1C n=1 Tax=Biomphalaria pfeifferi TaxID=112525 RepID=A0AAD8AW49_BIOPF|nr:crystallin J1C [Biomphalaria pfeifferi]
MLEIDETLVMQDCNNIAILARNLPESFQSTLHGVVTAAGYVAGIRSTIKVGGCNASRSGFIGACLAAKDGLDTIPESWKLKTKRFPEVYDLATKLVKLTV